MTESNQTDSEHRGFTKEDWRQVTRDNETRLYPNMVDKFRAMEERAEYQRLRNAVVEAARIERAVFISPIENAGRWAAHLSNAQMVLRRMVEALELFEREHGLDQR